MPMTLPLSTTERPLRAVPSQLQQSVAAIAIARVLADLDALPNFNFASSDWQRITRAAEQIVTTYVSRSER